MIYICKHCGKEFNGKPSAKRVYCSLECHNAAQSKKIELHCDECGKAFKRSPSNANAWDKHFCSQECRLKWLSRNTTENLNVRGHSKGHKAPHLTQLNVERNPKLALEVDAVKRGVYTDHRRIMEEHLGRKLKPWEDVHHINEIHNDNRIENLEVLPHSDHMKLHWKIAKERGLI